MVVIVPAPDFDRCPTMVGLAWAVAAPVRTWLACTFGVLIQMHVRPGVDISIHGGPMANLAGP